MNIPGSKWLKRTPYLRRTEAFTLIEIAISLAVIAFALVAIIGILPTGMNVQKENREETIINQDATVFMNAIRRGAKGADDLTNYVTAIRRAVTQYDRAGVVVRPTWVVMYTNSPWMEPGYEPFPLTNASRIVGLLSTPKYIPYEDRSGAGYYSNYIVAYARALSGMASEKAPQDNPSVRELAFSYRMIAESIPYSAFDSWWTNVNPQFVTDTNTMAQHSNYWMTARNLQANLHDLRLTFRWPNLPGDKLGSGRQTYRTKVSGGIISSNQPDYVAKLENTMFFYNYPSFIINTNEP